MRSGGTQGEEGDVGWKCDKMVMNVAEGEFSASGEVFSHLDASWRVDIWASRW